MSALTLRIIACVSMLLDHIGFLFAGRYPFLMPLRWVGRIAFPLYVFLIVNGFRHTHSRPLYALRLAVFAVLSQIPFTLFTHNRVFYPHLNVFVTLLCALLAVWATDALRKGRYTKYVCLLPALLLFVALYRAPVRIDYGAKGVLIAMVFYLFDGRPVLTAVGLLGSVYYARLLSLALALLSLLRGRGFPFAPCTSWELAQSCSLLALVPISLYNGSAGKLPGNPTAAKCIRLGFYAFYPLHLLLLYFLRYGYQCFS